MSERLILIFVSDVFNIDVKLQAELYDEFYRLVYDMVLYIVQDHASTEDIIQEAFMRALKKPPRYMDPQKIEAWLKTLTRNTALNHLRKLKNTRYELKMGTVYTEKPDQVFYQQLSIEQQVEAKLLRETLVTGIRQLKPEYRRVMELKYVHDFSYKEIAEILHTTEGTVRQRLARAREVLREMLQGKWGQTYEER